MAYITKTDIELWFNNEITLDQSLADDLIAKNSAYVDSLAGTKFEPTVVTDELITIEEPTMVIYTENKPLISVESLYVNKGDEFNPIYSEITDFIISNPKEGKIRVKSYITTGINKIKVSYTYGYNNTPELVKRLVTLLCVKDVLNIMLNKKSYNDEGDVDLGALKISGSFKYSLGLIKQLNEEIARLEDLMYGFRTYA